MLKQKKVKRRLGHLILWYALLAYLLIAVGVALRYLEPSSVLGHAESAVVIGDPCGPPPSQRVLLLHSYHAGYPWTDTITSGVRMALSGQLVALEVFYMDTKRRTDEAWKQEAAARARHVVAAWDPDLIIAVDDNAQEYFAKHYVGAKRPAIVFCGVNAEPETYGYPAPNVTGILERPHFEAGLNMLGRILPHARRLAIISDDSPTSAGALQYMTSASTPWQIVSCETPGTWEQWCAAVRRAQTMADALAIYMYHTIRPPGSGASMDPKDVMAWTVSNSGIPILGFFNFTIDDGALCGYVESGFEHGYEAGRLALRVLDGTRPDALPIVTALDGHAMINRGAARRWGLTVPESLRRSAEVLVE